MKAKKFLAEVKELARKYNVNFFIVTDGASMIDNNGNEAVGNCRQAHIKWELEHGLNPWEEIDEVKFNLKIVKDQTKYLWNATKKDNESWRNFTIKEIQENEQMKRQIELMKCRQNCMHGYEDQCKHRRCAPCSEWELKENT